MSPISISFIVFTVLLPVLNLVLTSSEADVLVVDFFLSLGRLVSCLEEVDDDDEREDVDEADECTEPELLDDWAVWFSV